MLQFFVLRLRNAATSDFVVQLLNLLRVKGLYFFSSSSEEAKKNKKDLEKYLINISHKFSEF